MKNNFSQKYEQFTSLKTSINPELVKATTLRDKVAKSNHNKQTSTSVDKTRKIMMPKACKSLGKVFKIIGNL